MKKIIENKWEKLEWNERAREYRNNSMKKWNNGKIDKFLYMIQFYLFVIRSLFELIVKSTNLVLETKN